MNQRQTSAAVEARKAIGARLRARREYLDIEREEMASMLDVTVSGYGHYETGFSEIPLSKLKKVAERLEAPVSYFLGEDEDAPLDQEDRDVIRFLHGMPPSLRASARAAVKAMHDANAREQTTHGKKAE